MMRSGKIAMDKQRRFIMKRFLSAILAIILLLCSLASCNDAQSEETSVETTLSIDETTAKPEKPKVPLNQTINIMCNTLTEDFVKRLVSGFKSTVYGVKVNLTVVEGGSDAYSEKISADVLGQNGPDIFIICDDHFKNTNDYIENGVFADIDEINAVWEYLNWDNYNEEVMNYGIVDGKRVMFPIFYSVPIIIGMKEVLDAEGIKYGDGVTFAEFADSCLNSSIPTFRKPIYFHNMYRYAGLNVIDEKAINADFEGEKFKSFMEDYLEFFPDIYNGGYSSLSIKSTGYTDTLCGALLAEDMLFFSFNHADSDYCNIPVFDSVITAIVENGNTPVITYIPSVDGKGPATTIEYSLAINSNTQYPEACMQFLRYASSIEYRADDNYFGHLFVNNKYREAIKDLYYGEELDVSSDYKKREFSFDYEDIDKEILDQYFAILDKAYVPEFVSTQALTYANSIALQVDKYGMTLDEAAKEYKRKLELFLTE